MTVLHCQCRSILRRISSWSNSVGEGQFYAYTRAVSLSHQARPNWSPDVTSINTHVLITSGHLFHSREHKTCIPFSFESSNRKSDRTKKRSSPLIVRDACSKLSVILKQRLFPLETGSEMQQIIPTITWSPDNLLLFSMDLLRPSQTNPRSHVARFRLNARSSRSFLC